MSYDRREFLKTLTLGGLALFTADWFKLVDETKAASAGKLLPAWPGDPIPSGHDVLNAVWQSGDGYALYLNGTPYDEPPTRTYREKLEAAGEYDVIRALEKLGTGKYEGIDDVDLLDEEADGGREDETWREFIGRRAPTFLETLEYIEAEGLPSSSYKLDDDIDSDRDEGFVTAWCRNNAPEAAATAYLSGLLEGLRAEKDKVHPFPPVSAPTRLPTAAKTRFFNQAFVLMGKKMRLHLRHRIHCHGDDDQQRRTAEIERHAILADQNFRDDADQAKIGGTKNRQPCQHAVKIVRRILAGANARNKAAILLQIIRRLCRIEDNGRVEKREKHNHRHIQDHVGGPPMGQHRGQGLQPAIRHILREPSDCCGQQQQRGSKDGRNDARCVDLQRKEALIRLHHAILRLTLGILDQHAALGPLHEADKGNQRDHRRGREEKRPGQQALQEGLVHIVSHSFRGLSAPGPKEPRANVFTCSSCNSAPAGQNPLPQVGAACYNPPDGD